MLLKNALLLWSLLFSLYGLESLDTHSLLFSDISVSNMDRFTVNTMNALNIPSEYIVRLKLEDKLIDKDTRMWEILIRDFENQYEFISVLRKMLTNTNIPQEFLFLAMVESGFKVRALSVKKAVGIWQLMPLTAKELGLVINDYVDERKDPIKSTQAAIKYLQYLYKNTGKWYLAAMAYNCGLGCVQRAIKRAGSEDIEVLLDEDEKYLPLETRNYLKKIMSISLAFSNAYRLKIDDKQYLLNRGANDSIVAVNVKSGNVLSDLAKYANMDLQHFKNLNSQFKYNFIPPSKKQSNKEYQVYIPYSKLSYFKQHFKESENPYRAFVVHKVKKGDTLSSISRKYNAKIEQIKNTNALQSSKLSLNQKLILPILKSNKIQLAYNK